MGKRAVLALLALAMAAALALTVRWASPYTAMVQPLPEIERIWEIEDTHELSEEPLLTALEWNGMPLVQEKRTGVFYCPIGLGYGEEWPELKLHIPGDPGTDACFADDYTWDACGTAVAEGTAYNLLAWTKEKYCYQQIVFTGMPILSLTTGQEEIGREDVPAEAVWASPSGGLASHARIHRRGASTMASSRPKHGYRVEFTRKADGKKKIVQDVPGLGELHSIVLLPLFHDKWLVREKLSWEIWNQLSSPDEPFGARRLSYCEVFLDGDYRGVYLALEPFKVSDELAKKDGARGLEDSVYRTAALTFINDRKHTKHPLRPNAAYELYYAPPGGEEFAALSTYIALITEKEDEVFAQNVLRYVDVDDLLRLDLFVQAGGMTDNIFNNMYIWADHSDGKLTYRFGPWDLDMSWGLKKDEIGEDYEYWMYFPLLDQMLDLDTGGIRTRLVERWQAYSEGPLGLENIRSIAERCAGELNDSGAMARNAERWETEAYTSDVQEILDFAEWRHKIIDVAVEQITSAEGRVDFLTETSYKKNKGGPIPNAVELANEKGEVQ